MQTLDTNYKYTTEVNRSKFIAYLFPSVQFKKLQEELKSKHPKANHIIYALRYLNHYDQVVENSSDDGEPKGCAGVPTLNVLRGKELINCSVLIVRYFGGIKLGTSGMARAYALATKNVIENAQFVLYEKKIKFEFSTSYSEVDKILYKLKQLELTIEERSFEIQSVDWKISGTESNIEKFKNM